MSNDTQLAPHQKITWMENWCAMHGLQLVQAGEVGFGRACVGVRGPGENDPYPDYAWYDTDGDWDRLDKNGEVWTPPNAYHKHPCVAVLGTGENALAELYDWLRWFDDNNFMYRTEKNEKPLHMIEIMMGRGTHHRMVKP